jgi:hypothetical protein
MYIPSYFGNILKSPLHSCRFVYDQTYLVHIIESNSMELSPWEGTNGWKIQQFSSVLWDANIPHDENIDNVPTQQY